MTPLALLRHADTAWSLAGRIQGLKSWLCDVAREAVPTLAVTHRGVICALLAEASGWDMRGKAPAKLDWHAVHFFNVAADGTPRVERLNVR